MVIPPAAQERPVASGMTLTATPGAAAAAWAAGVTPATQAAAPVNTVATRKALFIGQSFLWPQDLPTAAADADGRRAAIMLAAERGSRGARAWHHRGRRVPPAGRVALTDHIRPLSRQHVVYC